MKNEANMQAAANHVSLPGEGRKQRILGVSQIYKAESRHTGGTLICVEITVPPGQGIPPHRHSMEDESFYVLAGTITMEGDDCGSTPIALGAGSFFYGPRDRVHGFRNEGSVPAKLLVFVTPGSSIEAMFASLEDLTEQQTGGIDPARVAATCGDYGITFVQPA